MKTPIKSTLFAMYNSLYIKQLRLEGGGYNPHYQLITSLKSAFFMRIIYHVNRIGFSFGTIFLCTNVK